MKNFLRIVRLGMPLVLAAGTYSSPALAQDPVITPIIVDTAVPIIIKRHQAETESGPGSPSLRVTCSTPTSRRSPCARRERLVHPDVLAFRSCAAKMQQIIDKGGYQWGDKVTVYYDPATLKAKKFKGKPSKPV